MQPGTSGRIKAPLEISDPCCSTGQRRRRLQSAFLQTLSMVMSPALCHWCDCSVDHSHFCVAEQLPQSARMVLSFFVGGEIHASRKRCSVLLILWRATLSHVRLHCVVLLLLLEGPQPAIINQEEPLGHHTGLLTGVKHTHEIQRSIYLSNCPRYGL